MTTLRMRRLALLGGAGWLVVAGYGLDEVLSDNDDGWEVAYAIFTVALLLAAVSTVVLVAIASRQSCRPRLRMAGLVLCGLGCAIAVVGAWALPVWMTLLGVGLGLVGLASGMPSGRLLALLAAAQFVAVVVLIAGIEAEVGRRDEWGDHPMAGGIALVVVAGLTIAGIIGLMRAAGRLEAPVSVPSG